MKHVDVHIVVKIHRENGIRILFEDYLFKTEFNKKVEKTKQIVPRCLPSKNMILDQFDI